MRWVVLATLLGCGRIDFGVADAPTPDATACAGSTRWSADFTEGPIDPTMLDRNGDGIPDWVVRGGAPFPTDEVQGGAWVLSGSTIALDTNPPQDFLTRTIGSVRLRNTIAGTSGSGFGADFWFNVAWTDAGFVVAYLDVVLEPDSTQTATVVSWMNNPAWATNHSLDAYIAVPVVTLAGLDPGGFVDAPLDIDPTVPAVTVTIDGAALGTFALLSYTNAADVGIHSATLATLDGTAEFAYATIDVCP